MDTRAGDAAESTNEQTNVGFNYWPHPQGVIKADVQDQSGNANTDGFNLGIGYMF